MSSKPLAGEWLRRRHAEPTDSLLARATGEAPGPRNAGDERPTAFPHQRRNSSPRSAPSAGVHNLSMPPPAGPSRAVGPDATRLPWLNPPDVAFLDSGATAAV